ncbi:MAG: hypothetical protein IT371_07205 [Deltaproteobacteria bacterium]|nr:hypothetical protein [Deltaproteobacteria bacterium]
MRALTASLLALLLFLGSSRAWSEPSAGELEQRYQLLSGHRARLEAALTDHGRRIARLKAQTAGLQRDYQLQAALRVSQELAGRLTRIDGELRTVRGQLASALVLAAARTTDAQERDRLRRRREALLAEQQRASQNARIVTGGQVSPHDSAEDLEEKADLLKDSEEKVRKQLRRLQAQLGQLQHKARLERHSRAADDNPFVEDAPRRTARPKIVGAAATGDSSGAAAPKAPSGQKVTAPPAAGATTRGEDKGNNSDSVPEAAASPAPPAAPGSFSGGASAGGHAGGSGAPSEPARATAAPSAVGSSPQVGVTVRDVLDPATLRELERAGARGDLKARVAALKKASQQLDELARGLAARAETLRQRAKTLRRHK